MKADNIFFRRLFSKSMYKNKFISLGEMTFTKDFVNDTRGDLYPVIFKSENAIEEIENNVYKTKSGTIERMFVSFFPYGSYSLNFVNSEGKCGFTFNLPENKAEILFNGSEILFTDGKTEQNCALNENLTSGEMIISVRPGKFDVYFTKNNKPCYICTFVSEEFKNSNRQKTFERSFVCLKTEGKIEVSSVLSYLDCGVSQADIRAIKYENGDVLYENGKVYFTFSARIEEGGFQGIFSLVPTTSEINFTGALFFDSGDGFWRNYLASSLLFNRKTNEWYIWTSSFEDKHILCHASFKGEPRFGINVIDVTMMEKAESDDYKEFKGFVGDEDPDFYFDNDKNKWLMAICRILPETNKYTYVFFESDEPFANYKYIGKSFEGEETGGAFIKIGSETAFVCGNDFKKRSNYRIYTKNGMREAEFDFDDGGFRGWGCVVSIDMGSRRRYFLLTFDRHKGSNYNWSYGNIYCFEGIEKI